MHACRPFGLSTGLPNPKNMKKREFGFRINDHALADRNIHHHGRTWSAHENTGWDRYEQHTVQ